MTKPVAKRRGVKQELSPAKRRETSLDWGNNNSEKLIYRVIQGTELLNPLLH